VNLAGALEIRKVSTVAERHQLSIRDCVRDVRGDLTRDEIMLAVDNQDRDA